MIILLVTLSGWAKTDHDYLSITPKSAFDGVYNAIKNIHEGIKIRLTDRSLLDQRFEESLTAIRQQTPLPPVKGSADIYSYDQEILLANKLAWSPRPIFQSYSAYGEKLANINARHLDNSTAPQYIFFDINTIDNRFPSLEDGKSWPALLTYYDTVGVAKNFKLLKRQEHTADLPTLTLISQGIYTMEEPIFLPSTKQPIWAEIDVEPTLFGKIVATLFKASPLYLELKFPDGSKENYRYIASMGKVGFLISPSIKNSTDFIALRSPDRDHYFNGLRPQSIVMTGTGHFRQFWKRKFSIRFSKIVFPIQTSINQYLYASYDPWLTKNVIPSDIKMPGGECNIEILNGQSIPANPIKLARKKLDLKGWALVSSKEGIVSDKSFITLTDKKNFLVGAVHQTDRKDVNKYFGHPEMGLVGFETSLDLSKLQGKYWVHLIQTHHNKAFSCQQVIEIIIPN